MTAKFSVLCSLAALAIGCGASGVSTPRTADIDAPAKKTAKAPVKSAKKDSTEITVDKGPTPFAKREVGDYFVHRFSGSFSKSDLLLTEKVFAKRGSLIIIDYTLEEAGKKSQLRVTHDVDSDRVLRVKEIKGTQELPATEAQFEAMLARTVFLPDSNDALVGTESSTCLVGQEELDCEKTRYTVTIGDQTADLTVVRSEKLDGLDVSGEIATHDGKIMYKAELIERGKGTPAAGVASR